MDNFKYIQELLKNYENSDIDKQISPNDTMYNQWYFEIGRSAIENIAIACIASKIKEVKKVLDMLCGHGRVLRHLVRFFQNADFDACDLDRDGVDFCTTNFDSKPIYSRGELTEVDFGALYDLIWVGSLFTHTSLDVTKRWMDHLVKYLAPQGIIVATLHGRWCQYVHKVAPYIKEDAWQRILEDYSLSGYGYHDYLQPESHSHIAGSYGIALVKPHVTIRELESISDIRIYFYRERGWADHQDVVAFGHPGYDELWPNMQGIDTDREISECTTPPFFSAGGKNMTEPLIDVLDNQHDNNLSDKIQNISDDKWFALLCGDEYDVGLKNCISDMPPEQIQLNFTGSSGKATLTSAFGFYKLVKLYASKYGINLLNAHVLDFGVGWGRILRFFVKDVAKGRLCGVDPLPEAIEICESTVKAAEFYVIDPKAPIPKFQPNTFDLIYAYSVFSHLSEEYTDLWFQEFHRLLKSNGILIATTRSRAFIEHCAYLRESQQELPIHAQTLNRVFVDTQKRLHDYDAGIFCHQGTGGGDILTGDFFGESCIPKEYFIKNFSTIFIVEDFIEDLSFDNGQACIILKNK